MLKLFQKIFLLIICLFLIIPVFGFVFKIGIVFSNYLHTKELYSITSVNELTEATSAFDELEIDSCDCIWKAEIVFLGGVLESQISGKIVLQEDYFNDIITTYDWEKSADDNATNYSNIEGTEILYEFLNKGNYYVSETYQNTLKPTVYLSKEEQALYFYYYIY